MYFFKTIEYANFFRVIDRNFGLCSDWCFVSDTAPLRRDAQEFFRKRASMLSGTQWHQAVILRPFGFRDTMAQPVPSGQVPIIYQLAQIPRGEVNALTTREAIGFLNLMTYDQLNKINWGQRGNILVGTLNELPNARALSMSRSFSSPDADSIGRKFPPSRIPKDVAAVFYRYAAQPSHMAQPSHPDKWQKAEVGGWFPHIPYTGLRVICVPQDQMRLMGDQLQLDFIDALSQEYLNEIAEQGKLLRLHTPFGVPCAFVHGIPADAQEAAKMFTNPSISFNRFKDYRPKDNETSAKPVEPSPPPAPVAKKSNTASPAPKPPTEALAEEKPRAYVPHGLSAWHRVHDALTKPVAMRRNPDPLRRFLRRIKEAETAEP